MIQSQGVPSAPAECRSLLRSWDVGERPVPRRLRRACGDAFFRSDELQNFDLRIRRGGVTTRVRGGAQLLRDRATHHLAAFFLPLLREPPPGLRFLAAMLRGLQGKAHLTVVLEGEVGRGPAGFFRRRRDGEVHLVDTLSPRVVGQFETGLMDASTLYHELGHQLMYQLYGRQVPDYRGHSGHDSTALQHWEAETNPGAAWSEGFAGAMANLDYHSPKGIYGSGALDAAWFHKNLRARLANEYAIAALLTDYLKTRIIRVDGSTEQIWDEAACVRARKVFRTMRAAGVQADFGVFVRDFLGRHPEEGARLNPLLREYGFGELVKAKPGRRPPVGD